MNRPLPCFSAQQSAALVALVQGVVALSLTSRATFAERVATFGRPTPHAVLVWNFRDLIHPYMVLESPHEVTAFDFNPQYMEVVVGGCANGQVIMWELTEEVLARAAQVRSAVSRRTVMPRGV